MLFRQRRVGATPYVGTHWDNGLTNSDASIVRVSAIDSRGLEVCGFYSPTEPVPESGTIALIAAGLGVLALRRFWTRKALPGGMAAPKHVS